MGERTKRRLGFLVWPALALGVGRLALLLAGPGLWRVYPLLRRPAGAPGPGALAGGWLALCLLAGLALALAGGRARALWAAQMGAGAGWWWLCFGLGERGAALCWLAALLALAPALIVRFARAGPAAALLQLPWLACLPPAAWFNTALWLLNRG